MMLDCTATSPQNTPKYVINMFSHMRAIATLLGARAELTCPCRRLLFRQGHKGALNHRFFSKIFTFLNHRCQATTLFMALLAPNQVGFIDALLCWPDVLLLCAPAQNHQPTAMQSRGHSPGRVQPAAAGFTPWPGPVTLLKKPKP